MRRALRRPRERFQAPEPLPRVEGQLPPHDIAAEQAVHYCALNDRGAAEVAAAQLRPEDFYDPNLQRVQEAICDLVSNHHPVDVIAVASWLRDRKWPIGGMSAFGTWEGYVQDLFYNAHASSLYVDKYAKIVSLKARRRRIIAACQRTSAEGYFDVGDEQEWLNGVESTIAAQVHAPGAKSAKPVSEIIKTTFAKITARAEAGKRMDGIPSGYARLDDRTAGLHDGDLVIVAARPGMGKTSFVMNVAVNVASPRETTIAGSAEKLREPGFGVLVFSLEMPEEQLATRMVCSEGRVDLGKMRTSCLQSDDWRKATESASYLSSLPIWIDDTPAISLLELQAKVRRKQAEYNREATATQPARRIGLVLIDYLQLMVGEGDSREQEISYISRGLKAMAKELKVPVVALSQLNRAVETRGKDKRPQLSDLRESGAIEQDADTIIFIYRDDYYNPETTKLKGIADLIIAKQRNGPTGRVRVKFSASCTRFDNLEPGDYPDDDDE